jgi:hypothetical protein
MASESRSGTSSQRVAAKGKLKARDLLQRGRARVTRVSHVSINENVFHCCVHKTGSQWIRRMLADPLVYKYSGLRTYHYQSQLPGGVDSRSISDRSFSVPFPTQTIVTPLYINYANFAAIDRPDRSAGFFVMRDPRDIVISWYFSSRYSHRIMGDLAGIRSQLDSLPESEGFSYSIRHLNDFGLFSAIRSWMVAQQQDPSIKVFRFEDLVGDKPEEAFADMFSHCDIDIPASKVRQLLSHYSFRRSSGRDLGEEDQRAQYRKGVPGDWRNYFDDNLAAEFAAVTNDLAVELGYEGAS